MFSLVVLYTNYIYIYNCIYCTYSLKSSYCLCIYIYECLLIQAGNFPPLGDGLVTQTDVIAQEYSNGVIARLHVRLNVLLHLVKLKHTV